MGLTRMTGVLRLTRRPGAPAVLAALAPAVSTPASPRLQAQARDYREEALSAPETGFGDALGRFLFSGDASSLPDTVVLPPIEWLLTAGEASGGPVNERPGPWIRFTA
jgi:hypothetical protein